MGINHIFCPSDCVSVNELADTTRLILKKQRLDAYSFPLIIEDDALRSTEGEQRAAAKDEVVDAPTLTQLLGRCMCLFMEQAGGAAGLFPVLATGVQSSAGSLASMQDMEGRSSSVAACSHSSRDKPECVENQIKFKDSASSQDAAVIGSVLDAGAARVEGLARGETYVMHELGTGYQLGLGLASQPELGKADPSELWKSKQAVPRSARPTGSKRMPQLCAYYRAMVWRAWDPLVSARYAMSPAQSSKGVHSGVQLMLLPAHWPCSFSQRWNDGAMMTPESALVTSTPRRLPTPQASLSKSSLLVFACTQLVKLS